MGISRNAGTDSIVLDNLSDMSVSEIAEEYPTLRRDQTTASLDFMARSVENRS